MKKLLLVPALAMTFFAFGCNEKEAVFQPAVSKLTQSADALHKAGQVDQAICRLEAASELAPDNAVVHYNIGILLIEAHRWQAATEHLEMATKFDPKQYNAWYSLGVAYASWADDMHMQLQGGTDEEGKPVAKPPAGATPQELEMLRQKAAAAFEGFLKSAPSGDPGRAQAQAEVERFKKPLQ